MYRQNRDLILVGFIGFIYYALVVGLTGHLNRVPLGEYFLIPMVLAIFMSFSIKRPSQIIEWPLCFLFGGTIATANIIIILGALGMEFSLNSIAFTLSHTYAWFGMVSAMMLVGILIGLFVKTTYTLMLGSLNITFEWEK